MAEESSNEYTPLDLSMKGKATSTSRDGTQDASSTLGAYNTISDEGLRYQRNTQHTPMTDEISSVDAAAKNGSRSCQPLGSIKRIDNAKPSSSPAGMEEASANSEDGTTNACGTRGREQRDLCGVCGNLSSRRDALYGSTKEHVDESANICKACGLAYVKKSNFVEHCGNSTEKAHKCETCGKEFRRADYLIQHYRTHTNERPYKCNICDKSFKHSSHLDIHMGTHTEERPYKCQMCYRSFQQASDRDDHERNHTEQSRHKCQICNKLFRRASHLENHKRTHTGEKPYICKTCGNSFAQVAHLRRHESAHAEGKSCVCQKCSKSFKNQYDLKIHVDSQCGNNPFVCEICDRSFVNNSNLRRHQQAWHADKTPYECKQCGCRFADQETRDRHVCPKECKI
ncbi:zinc finger protein 436-like isoform X1 [Dermacentor albipictus]|uniref:zinc finger protein 436-like isoform X1 n=1 Tax=Dermacentor albipictus TaxID=60249 RepID=UPI0038FC7EDF